MDHQLPPRIRDLQQRAAEVVAAHVAPHAAAVDAEARWPAHSMRAFAEAGLMGLQVPTDLGGHGQGLLALSVLTETIARACPSSALCFGMHCVGTAVIAAKATDYHKDRYLAPIAQGRHITTLALSESGSGSHFYLPRTPLREEGERFVIDGEKQFVTNGGHADSYVLSVAPADREAAGAGDFSLRLLADWVHLGLVSLWVGEVAIAGVFAMKAAPEMTPDDRRARAAYVRSLSNAATVALAGIVVTGLYAAWRNVGGWSNLTGTAYGQTLVAKVLVVGVAAALGGFNRFCVLPAWLARESAGDAAPALLPARFRHVLWIEAAVLLAAVVLAAWLASTSPPAGPM